MAHNSLLIKVFSRRGRGAAARPVQHRSTGWRAVGMPVWGAMAVTLAALGVLLTGTGLDLLLLLVLLCGLVALERTIGDWTADLLGPGLASIVLVIVAGLGVWFLFARNGKAEQFYRSAEQSGYSTTLHNRSTPPDPNAPSTAGAAAESTGAAAGASVPTSGASLGVPAAASSRGPQASTRNERLSLFRRSTGVQLAMRIDTPELSTTGKPITLRARVTAGGHPMPDMPVTFMVDGRAAGSGVTDSEGTVSTAFVPKVARTYQVEARVASSKEFRSTSARSVLYVLPARSSLLPSGGVGLLIV